ncbi:hypothetical protein FRC15_010969 [Serendipita sp. 397]|nr:hypothetical protein FRC15_010969 [Serendipita sp. 397]
MLMYIYIYIILLIYIPCPPTPAILPIATTKTTTSVKKEEVALALALARRDMETISDVIYRGPWWQNRGIRNLNLCIALVELASIINGYDSSVLNGNVLPPLPHPKKERESLMCVMRLSSRLYRPSDSTRV